MSHEKAALKYVAKLTRKHLYWCLFNKVAVSIEICEFYEKDSGKVFKDSFWVERLQTAASGRSYLREDIHQMVILSTW